MTSNKQLNELYLALGELQIAVQDIINTRDETGKTELTLELISANQEARLLVEEKYLWIAEGMNESAAMTAAEGE